MKINHCYIGDCRASMRDLIAQGMKVQTIVTSPPYFGLRDYGVAGQLGLEETPQEYVANMVEVFCSARELLAEDGVLWLNLGDSYATKQSSWLKPKDLVGIPWRVAFALQEAGWYLRMDIIWSKPNPMPESVTDRCTKAHEYIFMLTKSSRYFYDHEAIKEPAIYFDDDRKSRAKEDHKSAPTAKVNGIRAVYKDARSYDGKHTDKQRGHGRKHVGFNARWDAMDKAEQCGSMRNKRSVWTVATNPYPGAHFATFPPALIEPCILAGSRPGDIVFDPFLGSGTTAQVAQQLGRQWIGCELNEDYLRLQNDRTRQQGLELMEVDG